jgi:hypothetical protein
VASETKMCIDTSENIILNGAEIRGKMRSTSSFRVKKAQVWFGMIEKLL